MDLKLPNLGEGADSGTVVSIFVKEGDQLAKDQPVLELENEKAVATIPSNLAGKVTKIYIKAGEKISVGQKILAVTEDGAPAESTRGEAGPAKAAPKRTEREPESQEPRDYKQEPESREPVSESIPGIPVAAAPSLRKIGRDLGIDLTKVRGSARGGRI